MTGSAGAVDGGEDRAASEAGEAVIFDDFCTAQDFRRCRFEIRWVIRGDSRG